MIAVIAVTLSLACSPLVWTMLQLEMLRPMDAMPHLEVTLSVMSVKCIHPSNPSIKTMRIDFDRIV